MRYYIIAGEASGDLHAANLISELRKKDPQAKFRAWGGDHILNAGVSLVNHYRDTAFMGFVEVIKHLPQILNFIRQCKQDIMDWQPDVIILVDYPGFNFRIAEFTHNRNIRTVYYISPQLWAWKSSRIKKVKLWVDELLVILPFEKDFYKKYNVDAHFVGHPLMDEIHKPQAFEKIELEKDIIALLPGSRKQEIERMLPYMLRLSADFPEHKFIVAGLSSLSEKLYQEIEKYPQVDIIYNRTYDLLASSQAAIVTSGTATLETALFRIPQIVVYRSSPINYFLGKRLIKVKFISLVNLILDRLLVKELIQGDMTIERMKTELNRLLHDAEEKKVLAEGYDELINALGSSGASSRAAKIIFDLTANSSSE